MFTITMVGDNPVFRLISEDSAGSVWRYDSKSDKFVTYNASPLGLNWRTAVQESVGLGSIGSEVSVIVNPLRKSQVAFKAYVI